MTNGVVNLNKFRKKKERDERAKKATTNRLRHGRTKAEKQRERDERARADRLLAGKRLERVSDEAARATPLRDDAPSDHAPSDHAPSEHPPTIDAAGQGSPERFEALGPESADHDK